MANTVKDTAKSRKVAILAADGVDGAAVDAMKKALTAAGAVPKVIGPRGGTLNGGRGARIPVDFSLLTVGSVLFDAVFVPGGADSVKALTEDAKAVLFVNEAYKHCKAIAAVGAGLALLPPTGSVKSPAKAGAIEEGVIAGGDADVAKVASDLIRAMAQHRAWSREAKAERIPA